jgi:hypothetical protein
MVAGYLLNQIFDVHLKEFQKLFPIKTSVFTSYLPLKIVKVSDDIYL